ncbi:hypothetical protein ACF1GX_29700 [Streptomyces albidoflavus]
MRHTRSSDEQHLLELLCLLPEPESKFWQSVLKLAGLEGDWPDFNPMLREAVSAGNCLSLSNLVLTLFGPPEHRDGLPNLVGRVLLTNNSYDDRGVGEQWIKDAMSTAWRVHFSYARPQDEDPLEVLKHKWDLG